MHRVARLGGGGSGVEEGGAQLGVVRRLQEQLFDIAEVGGAEDVRFEPVRSVRFGSADSDRFGPYGEGGRVAWLEAAGLFGADASDRRIDGEGSVFALLYGSVEEVGVSDEVRGEHVRRLRVDLSRRPDLYQLSAAHEGDAVGEGERFFLVVGDVDGGQFQFAVDAFDLLAHFVAQFGVQVAERFVEQEDVRFGDERSGEGDALLLSAGELVRVPLFVGGHLDDLERFHDAPFFLVRFDLAYVESVLYILVHGHMGPEGVVLEHHRGVALVRRGSGDSFVSEVDFAFVRVVESGDSAEERRFAAAGRSEEEEQFAFGYFEGESVDGDRFAEAFGDRL